MVSQYTIIPITVAFVCTLLCIELIKPLARKIGLVDVPSDRKQHQGLIPLIGGIGIAYGFLMGILTVDYGLTEYRPVIACLSVLLVVGITDDFRELSPKLRFLSQLLVAIFMVSWGHNAIFQLGNLFDTGSLTLAHLSLPVTIIAVMGITNAMNIMDGQDGLAGGIALIQAVILTLLAYTAGNHDDSHLLSVLCGAIAAFLVFNFPLPGRQQARIFLGDAGSTLLGFTLCWFCIKLSQPPYQAAQPITFLWIMGLPIVDTLTAIIRRLLQKQSPFKPDTGHLHHILQRRGLGKHLSTPAMICLSLLLSIAGLAGEALHIPAYLMLLSFFAFFCVYLFTIIKMNKKYQALAQAA